MNPFFTQILCFPKFGKSEILDFAEIYSTKNIPTLEVFFKKFGIVQIYTAANKVTAAKLLSEQIKPFLGNGEKYAVICPIGYKDEIQGTHTQSKLDFAVLVFGTDRSSEASSVSLAFAKTYCAKLREWYQKYITNVSINSTDFSTFSDDFSETSQFTALCTLSAVLPYSGEINCN